MSKHKVKGVDMSLPPEDRGRRRKNRMGGTPPAQMSYASKPRLTRQQRDGERKMEIEQRLRTGAARSAEEAAEVAVLDDEAFATRVLAKLPEDARPAMEALLRREAS